MQIKIIACKLKLRQTNLENIGQLKNFKWKRKFNTRKRKCKTWEGKL